MRKSRLCHPDKTRLLLLGLLEVYLLVLSGCAPNAYITPNYREYTTGGIFEDKYWNPLSGGKNVKLEGTFNRVDTRVLDGVEKLMFEIVVPDGLNPVTVYATRDFSTQLYELRQGESISVYGKTLSLRSSSRQDQGLVGNALAVELHKIEKTQTPKEEASAPAEIQDVEIKLLVALGKNYVGKDVRTKAWFGQLNDLPQMFRAKECKGEKEAMFFAEEAAMGYSGTVSFHLQLTDEAVVKTVSMSQKTPFITEGKVYKTGSIPGLGEVYVMCVSSLKAPQ